MLSVFSWLAILICLLIIKNVFILPYEDRQLFKLYESRDNISLEVMKNEISQTSEEYNFVIESINFWIYYTRNDYDFSIALKNIINTSKDMEKSYDVLKEKISSNDKLKKGFDVAYKHSKEVMRIKGFLFTQVVLRLILVLLELALIIVNVMISISDIGHKTSARITDYISESRQIQDDYKSYANNVLRKRI